jgi:hypothetical protein
MADASGAAEEGERPDTSQWGMDPLFYAPVRLLATHLALLTPVPQLAGTPPLCLSYAGLCVLQ